MITKEQIRDEVLGHFLFACLPAFPEDIAKRLGCSESTVRRALRENHGAVEGTRAVRWGNRWAYKPALTFMRDRLLAALGRSDPLDERKTS
jgi:hypothetical protein